MMKICCDLAEITTFEFTGSQSTFYIGLIPLRFWHFYLDWTMRHRNFRYEFHPHHVLRRAIRGEKEKRTPRAHFLIFVRWYSTHRLWHSHVKWSLTHQKLWDYLSITLLYLPTGELLEWLNANRNLSIIFSHKKFRRIKNPLTVYKNATIDKPFMCLSK